jgi:hypothetical protein
LLDTSTLGKNAKLYPKWTGSCDIIDVNKNGKIKIVNIKPYCKELTTCLSEDASCSSESTPRLSQDTSQSSQDTPQELPQRPLTRALKKLNDFINTAIMAMHLISDASSHCPGNIFEENYDKYHSKN